ncbi:hypothetical protein [Mumia sp. DW29H23]|uniref:hypothetical protein n=1 Tax=Mumia sp. DW29H23 TaxID=3421241 RepID=UPI003D690F1D
MPRKHARQRARYNEAVGQERGALYRHALTRAQSAYDDGYFLETIALVESLMADRLEALLSLIDGSPVKFGTVGEAVVELKRRFATIPGVDDVALFAEVTAWSRDRARWIHEFAKLSAVDNLGWDERVADARRVAEQGLALLKRVTAESAAVMRSARADTQRIPAAPELPPQPIPVEMGSARRDTDPR